MVTVFYQRNSLKPCSPAIARKLLRKSLATIAPHVRGCFAIRLKNEEAYQEYLSSFTSQPSGMGIEGGA